MGCSVRLGVSVRQTEGRKRLDTALPPARAAISACLISRMGGIWCAGSRAATGPRLFTGQAAGSEPAGTEDF